MLIQQGLKKLGFDENEIRTYVAIAEAGKSTATVIAKRAGIPRGTIYGILNSLMERGVIALEGGVGTSFYVVCEPASLLRMVERERDKIESKVETAKNVVDLILPFIHNAPTAAPKLRFFEGKRGIENMLFQDLPAWRKSFAFAKDYVAWGIVDHTMMEEYRRWLLHRWSLLGEHPDERIHLFSNRPAVAEQIKKRVPGREIRQLPNEFEITGSVFLYGEYLIMMMTRQVPHVAFQLHSPTLASNLRTVFRLLWSVTPPTKVRS